MSSVLPDDSSSRQALRERAEHDNPAKLASVDDRPADVQASHWTNSIPTNLLIVDDHPLDRKLLRAMLEAEGVTVHEAADGQDALSVLEAQPVDAIVSDVLMPNMDGYRLCYEVRHRPGLQSLPFVFFTSTYTSFGDEKLAREMGADAFLSKPAGAARIIDVLRKISLRSRPKSAPDLAAPLELEVMKHYSERLVAKLEEQNARLQQRTTELEHEMAERKRAEAMIACQLEVLELIATHAPLARTLDTMLRRLEAIAPDMLCSILLLAGDGLHVRHGAAPSLPDEFNRAVDG